MENNATTKNKATDIQCVPTPNKQEIRKFAAAIKDKLLQRYGGRYDIEIREVLKNNGLNRTALCIGKKEWTGMDVAPVIYMDGYCQRSREGMDAESICDEIMGIWERAQNHEGFEIGSVMDAAKAKAGICYKLINADANGELLEKLPHRRYLDMAVTYYMDVSVGNKMDATMAVTWKLLESWGMDEETLYGLACENTVRNLGCRILPITDKLMEIAQPETMEQEEAFRHVLGDTPPMYIASNGTGLFGACVMLNGEMLRQFAGKSGGDFYILPSSIHELIFLPAKAAGGEAESLGKMVREINADVLDPDEVLSDHVYYYSMEEGRISIVA